jgi:hypothetical protein
VKAQMVAERRHYTKPQQRAFHARLRDRESVRLWGTKDVCRIETPAEAWRLPLGTWVYDRRGVKWCLVDTHVGWPQRMFMSTGSRSCVSVEWMSYPLAEAVLYGDCTHSWGTQECGHCRSCGQLVGEPKNLDWGVVVLTREDHVEQEAEK